MHGLFWSLFFFLGSLTIWCGCSSKGCYRPRWRRWPRSCPCSTSTWSIFVAQGTSKGNLCECICSRYLFFLFFFWVFLWLFLLSTDFRRWSLDFFFRLRLSINDISTFICIKSYGTCRFAEVCLLSLGNHTHQRSNHVHESIVTSLLISLARLGQRGSRSLSFLWGSTIIIVIWKTGQLLFLLGRAIHHLRALCRWTIFHRRSFLFFLDNWWLNFSLLLNLFDGHSLVIWLLCGVRNRLWLFSH